VGGHPAASEEDAALPLEVCVPVFTHVSMSHTSVKVNAHVSMSTTCVLVYIHVSIRNPCVSVYTHVSTYQSCIKPCNFRSIRIVRGCVFVYTWGARWRLDMCGHSQVSLCRAHDMLFHPERRVLRILAPIATILLNFSEMRRCAAEMTVW
jgi:hypothetical protein